MIKEFDSYPVYDKKHRKTNVKFCNDKITTNFHCDGVSKEHSHFILLSAILIDYVLNMGKKYYPEAFLEECRYALEK